MRYLLLLFSACCLVAVAPDSSFAGARLDYIEMQSVQGGCAGCEILSDSCGLGCVPGVCDLTEYCDSAGDNHVCYPWVGSPACHDNVVPGGCGGRMTDGACISWRCQGGTYLGKCAQNITDGLPC